MRQYGGFQLVQALIDAEKVSKTSDVGSKLFVDRTLQVCNMSANASHNIMVLVRNI